MAFLELLYVDVYGKISIIALGVSFYFLFIVDDYNKNMWMYFLQDKAEILDKFVQWHKWMENENNKNVKKFHTDRGGKFLSNEFKKYYCHAPPFINSPTEALVRWNTTP